MAANLTEKQVEGTMIVSIGKQRGQGRRQRIGRYGLVAATLVAVLIFGVEMRNRQASRPMSAVIPHSVVSAAQYYDDLMSQQEDFLHTMDARTDALPAIRSSQDFTEQQVMEFDTLTVIGQSAAPTATSASLAVAADDAVAVPAADDRFSEVNATDPPSAYASAIRVKAGPWRDFTEQQVVEFDALTAIDQGAKSSIANTSATPLRHSGAAAP